MRRRGQAAVEYLVTYGWVFLVILGAIFALSYFGLLSPSNYLPASCDFGQQLRCVDQYMDTDGQAVLRFQNLYGVNITIVDAFIYNTTSENQQSVFVGGVGSPGPVNISRNDIGRVEFYLIDGVTEANKERVEVIFTFRRQDGTILHNVSGVVFGDVSEPLSLS